MSCSVKISSKAWSATSGGAVGGAMSASASCPVIGHQTQSQPPQHPSSPTTPLLLHSHRQQQQISPSRLPSSSPVKSMVSKKGEDISKLLKYVDDNVIGKNGTFLGPFGRRKGKFLSLLLFIVMCILVKFN